MSPSDPNATKFTALWGIREESLEDSVKLVNLIDCSTEHLSKILQQVSETENHPYIEIIKNIISDRHPEVVLKTAVFTYDEIWEVLKEKYKNHILTNLDSFLEKEDDSILEYRNKKSQIENNIQYWIENESETFFKNNPNIGDVLMVLEDGKSKRWLASR